MHTCSMQTIYLSLVHAGSWGYLFHEIPCILFYNWVQSVPSEYCIHIGKSHPILKKYIYLDNFLFFIFLYIRPLCRVCPIYYLKTFSYFFLIDKIRSAKKNSFPSYIFTLWICTQCRAIFQEGCRMSNYLIALIPMTKAATNWTI